MARDEDWVQICVDCGTTRAPSRANWEGGDWGAPCKGCGSPTITCPRDKARQYIEQANRRKRY